MKEQLEITMKFVIEYHYIQSDHIFAIPTFHHSETIECKHRGDLENYIAKQRDQYNNPFKYDKSFGFDYISARGGLKVYPYQEPKFKKV
jgi:hypothetical protein